MASEKCPKCKETDRLLKEIIQRANASALRVVSIEFLEAALAEVR